MMKIKIASMTCVLIVLILSFNLVLLVAEEWTGNTFEQNDPTTWINNPTAAMKIETSTFINQIVGNSQMSITATTNLLDEIINEKNPEEFIKKLTTQSNFNQLWDKLKWGTAAYMFNKAGSLEDKQKLLDKLNLKQKSEFLKTAFSLKKSDGNLVDKGGVWLNQLKDARNDLLTLQLQDALKKLHQNKNIYLGYLKQNLKITGFENAEKFDISKLKTGANGKEESWLTYNGMPVLNLDNPPKWFAGMNWDAKAGLSMSFNSQLVPGGTIVTLTFSEASLKNLGVDGIKFDSDSKNPSFGNILINGMSANVLSVSKDSKGEIKFDVKIESNSVTFKSSNKDGWVRDGTNKYYTKNREPTTASEFSVKIIKTSDGKPQISSGTNVDVAIVLDQNYKPTQYAQAKFISFRTAGTVAFFGPGDTVSSGVSGAYVSVASSPVSKSTTPCGSGCCPGESCPTPTNPWEPTKPGTPTPSPTSPSATQTVGGYSITAKGVDGLTILGEHSGNTNFNINLDPTDKNIEIARLNPANFNVVGGNKITVSYYTLGPEGTKTPAGQGTLINVDVEALKRTRLAEAFPDGKLGGIPISGVTHTPGNTEVGGQFNTGGTTGTTGGTGGTSSSSSTSGTAGSSGSTGVTGPSRTVASPVYNSQNSVNINGESRTVYRQSGSSYTLVNGGAYNNGDIAVSQSGTKYKYQSCPSGTCPITYNPWKKI